jgi:hypothetical protein
MTTRRSEDLPPSREATVLQFPLILGPEAVAFFLLSRTAGAEEAGT